MLERDLALSTPDSATGASRETTLRYDRAVSVRDEEVVDESEITSVPQPAAGRAALWDDSITKIDQVLRKYRRIVLTAVLLVAGSLMFVVLGHRSPTTEGAPEEFSTTADAEPSRLKRMESDVETLIAPEVSTPPPMAIALGPQGHAQRRLTGLAAQDQTDDSITPLGPIAEPTDSSGFQTQEHRPSASPPAYPSTDLPAIGIGESAETGASNATAEEVSNVAVLRGARPIAK